ncbi:MAG: Allophanate hydrolase 2 subunit 2 (EC [uncultured Sulfurovum sp.]|uniref:Allophanate hydrolase 2 subunit 2 (EC) n=1 Tax=uncultured Sulfurovum sp. TaxID=269237 RepID=A0A6S6TSM4_9BACT|nr:MAG: Allophanate hydrolase 2 subunit 2 (EC [uncultured Sulfurovum sp.]
MTRCNLKGFKVLQAGLFTTLQDQGRNGYKHLGITESGAMDEYAYLWSQKLLNNKNANALEVMVGLKIEVQESTIIAICGADLGFEINGMSKPIWQTYSVQVGDVLSFPKRVSGQRSYLAVKDGFHTKKEYGSYATTLKENIGSKVQKNDILTFTTQMNYPKKYVKKAYIPNYNKTLTLRLSLSYQDRYFSQEEQEKFFNSDYEITLESNRMGAKLKGKPISPKENGIISEGICFGSVQIPQDGQPILLLKERQTIGGYPKIGTVLAIDCFRFAQLSVGDKVRFEKIDLKMAREKTLKFYNFFKDDKED